MHRKCLDEAPEFEHFYDTNMHRTGMPVATELLEALLLTPATSECLPELSRLIEFIEKFGTQANFDVSNHSHLVLALAKYRAGQYQDALQLLDNIPVSAPSVYETNSGPFAVGQKSFALRALIYHDQDLPVSALEEYYKLEKTVDFLRQWQKRDVPTWAWFIRGRYGFLTFDILRREARNKLSDGSTSDQWFDQSIEALFQDTAKRLERAPDDLNTTLDRLRLSLLQARIHADKEQFEFSKRSYQDAQALAVKAVTLESDNPDVEMLALRSISDFAAWPQIFDDNNLSDDLNNLLTNSKNFPKMSFKKNSLSIN